MKDLIAYCGLDCEACDARIATLTDDNALREKTAALWSQLNNAPITADMINCTGCRVEGVKTPYCNGLCPIRRCAMEKGFATCGECPQRETCESLSPVISTNEAAKANLCKG